MRMKGERKGVHFPFPLYFKLKERRRVFPPLLFCHFLVQIVKITQSFSLPPPSWLLVKSPPFSFPGGEVVEETFDFLFF